VLATSVEITQNVSRLTPGTAYHWCARLLYRPGNRLGQSIGRWVHVPWNGWTEQDFRTPAVTYTTGMITYACDPLSRLISAGYSTGESFAYRYDAGRPWRSHGNRTAYTATAPLAGTTVTTYTYDAANRLLVSQSPWSPGHVHLGCTGQPGQRRHVYICPQRCGTHGACLSTNRWAEGVTLTLVYTYNSAGLRVAQSVNGEVTPFAWDWATGVPEMLSDGQAMGSSIALYVVGHETLGRWNGAVWTYYLPDTLGLHPAGDGWNGRGDRQPGVDAVRGWRWGRRRRVWGLQGSGFKTLTRTRGCCISVLVGISHTPAGLLARILLYQISIVRKVLTAMPMSLETRST
jgi:hypothetical protein